MAGKFPCRGSFSYPSALIDEYEWIMDSFIDGDLGAECTLVYPPKYDECNNCYLDLATGRSNNIYKTGGPNPFTNHTVCPVCGGEGRLTVETTDSVRLRVYTNPKDWKNIGVKLNIPEGSAQIIGYFTDLPKIQRAKYIWVFVDLEGIQRWKYVSSSEPLPWGLRGSRYFIMMVKRYGGS